MNNEEILERIRAGDELIFREVYTTYRDEFVAWARKRFSFDRDQCLEIFQASVVVMYDNLVTGKLTKLTSSLKTYLFSIGRNLSFEDHRVMEKGRQLAMHLEYHLEKEGVELDELFDKMYRGLDHLDEPCQQVMIKHYFKNLSSTELADEMGYKNADTAKTKKYKCLQKLKNLIEKESKEIS